MKISMSQADEPWEVSVTVMRAGYHVLPTNDLIEARHWGHSLPWRTRFALRKSAYSLEWPVTEEELAVSVRECRAYCERRNASEERMQDRFARASLIARDPSKAERRG